MTQKIRDERSDGIGIVVGVVHRRDAVLVGLVADDDRDAVLVLGGLGGGRESED